MSGGFHKIHKIHFKSPNKFNKFAKYFTIIEPMTPKEVILKYIKAFNDANIRNMAELYADDAVNHQVMFEPVKGQKAIKKMLEHDFAQTKMVCIIENIFEDGEWITLEWKESQGLRGCEIFRVVNSKIQLQRGYWDRLAFYKEHDLQTPQA